MIASATREKQDGIHGVQHSPGVVAEQFGHDRCDVLQRVGNRARLLENFLLHVIAVKPQVSRPAMRRDGMHPALDTAASGVDYPMPVKLDIGYVAVLQVGDLI